MLFGILRCSPFAARRLPISAGAALLRHRPALGDAHATGRLHNPQGRVIALLRIFQREPGEILALLPKALALSVSEQLRRYVLRAKVQILEASGEFQLLGIEAEASEAAPSARRSAARSGDAERARLRTATPRHGARSGACAGESAGLGAAGTRRRHSARGTATSGQFVAQMLNLDLLHAISFTKGCYTGQEVIARAHYRAASNAECSVFISRGAVVLPPPAVGGSRMAGARRSCRPCRHRSAHGVSGRGTAPSTGARGRGRFSKRSWGSSSAPGYRSPTHCPSPVLMPPLALC